MEKITTTQLSNDIFEFGRVSENRNKQDQRFGQWFVNKYHILAPDDIHGLFYRESYIDCMKLITEHYVRQDYE